MSHIKYQNITVNITGNTAGASQAIYASSIYLAGGNNITLSQNSNTVTIVGANTGGGAGINTLGMSNLGNTSGTSGVISGSNLALYLAGGNNVTLSQSINASSATITISGPSQSIQTQNMLSIQGSTGNISFGDANGITFGGNNSTLTASHNALTSQSNQALSGSNGSFAFQTATFGNLNGISFYTSNGSMVGSYTVPTQTVQPVALSGSNGSFNFSTATFGNLNGMSFYSSNGSMVGSYTVPTQSVQPVAISGSNGSFNFSTVTFGNLNGMSFYSSNNSFVGSYTVPTVPAQFSGGNSNIGNTSGDNGVVTGRLVLAGGNNITLSGSTNAGSMTITVSAGAGGGGFSGGVSDIGNSSGATGTVGSQIVFAGGNNITLSQSVNGNSATVTVSAANGGAGVTLSHYSPVWAVSGRATNSSLGQNTLYFNMFDLPYYVSASRINFYISVSGVMSAGNSTGTCYQVASYALYSRDTAGASTQSLRSFTSYGMTYLSQSFTSNTQYRATHYFGLSNVTSHSTLQTAISSSNATTYLSTNVNGPRVLAFPVNSVLTPGRYWLGFAVSTITGNAMTNNVSVQVTSVGIQPAVYNFGSASGATNASVFRAMTGFGSYSATSNAFPGLIALSTNQIRNPVAITQIHFDIMGMTQTTNMI